MTGNNKETSLFSSVVLALMAAIGWGAEILMVVVLFILRVTVKSAKSPLSYVARLVKEEYMKTQPFAFLRGGAAPEKQGP